MVRTDDKTLPIIREVRAMVNEVLSLMKLTTVKKSRMRSATGTACNMESNLFGEITAETIITTANIRRGIFNGLSSSVILPSRTLLIPHNINRIREATIIRSCFGNV